MWNSELGFDPDYVPIPANLQDKYNDLQEEARLAQNVKSSGNIKINKPSSGDLVYDKPSENGLYGPFNITYPSYLSSETGKQEFIGNEFVITVNDKELSFLPESGEDFYLTELDGIKIGEKNTVKIKYKGNYNYRGNWRRYTALRSFTIVPWCERCHHIDSAKILSAGFEDFHTGEIYLPLNLRDFLATMKCVACGWRRIISFYNDIIKKIKSRPYYSRSQL